MQASETRWSHPSLRACPRITSPLAGKHLISPFGTVTLQSFPCNYTLLMLCNLARRNLGCSDTVIDISWRCFFPMVSMKSLCLIMVRLGFLSQRLCVVPLTARGHHCTLCFHSQQAQYFQHVRLYWSFVNAWFIHWVLYRRNIIYKCPLSIYDLTAEQYSLHCLRSEGGMVVQTLETLALTQFYHLALSGKENWKVLTIFRVQ